MENKKENNKSEKNDLENMEEKNMDTKYILFSRRKKPSRRVKKRRPRF